MRTPEPVRPIRPQERPAGHDEARVCEQAGCTTRLSRYNPERLCWKHADRRRGREPSGGASG